MRSTSRVNTLGVKTRDRVISRICFYVLVATAMWTTNRLLPSVEELYVGPTVRIDHQLQLAQPLIAVPISELRAAPAGLISR